MSKCALINLYKDLALKWIESNDTEFLCHIDSIIESIANGQKIRYIHYVQLLIHTLEHSDKDFSSDIQLLNIHRCTV